MVHSQRAVAAAKYAGMSLRSVAAACQQLSQYASALQDDVAAPQLVDKQPMLISEDGEEVDDDTLDVQMGSWFEVRDCKDAIRRLHACLVHSSPPSTHPKVGLQLG